MANHPNRSRSPYTVKIGGTVAISCEAPSLREAQAIADAHGEQAAWCLITDRHGTTVVDLCRIEGEWKAAAKASAT